MSYLETSKAIGTLVERKWKEDFGFVALSQPNRMRHPRGTAEKSAFPFFLKINGCLDA